MQALKKITFKEAQSLIDVLLEVVRSKENSQIMFVGLDTCATEQTPVSLSTDEVGFTIPKPLKGRKNTRNLTFCVTQAPNCDC